MTPVTLTIDRRFPSIGRIKKRTGTTIPAVKRKLDRMLTALYEEGRLDLLRAIRDGHITLLQAHDAYQRRALGELPTAATAKPLDATMTAWINRYDCSPEHRRSLHTSRRHLLTVQASAMLADLPALLEELRSTLGRRSPRSFNHCRSAGLSFVRATLKRSHPLWLQIAGVERVKVRRVRASHPLMPEEMRAAFPSPFSDPVDSIAWGMATTGMGSKEYWGTWMVLSDRIHIFGTKREGRVRDVPLVHRSTPPAIHRRTFDDGSVDAVAVARLRAGEMSESRKRIAELTAHNKQLFEAHEAARMDTARLDFVLDEQGDYSIYSAERGGLWTRAEIDAAIVRDEAAP